MKGLGTFIMLVAIAFAGWLAYSQLFDRPVTEREFRQAHEFLNRRVDTLSRNQKVMIRNQKIMYHNQRLLLDSLQEVSRQLKHLQSSLDSLRSEAQMLRTGQMIIYDAVVNANPQPAKTRSTWKRLIQWFNGK